MRRLTKSVGSFLAQLLYDSNGMTSLALDLCGQLYPFRGQGVDHGLNGLFVPVVSSGHPSGVVSKVLAESRV